MNQQYTHPKFQRGLFRSRAFGAAVVAAVAIAATAAIGPVYWYVPFPASLLDHCIL